MSTDLIKQMIREARGWCHNKVKLDGGLSDEVIIVRNLCVELEKALPLIAADSLKNVRTEKEKSCRV